MIIEEKFNKRNAKQHTVYYSDSMNFAEIQLKFKPEDCDDQVIGGKSLSLWMSREEALRLGEILLQYGNMALDYEKEAVKPNATT